MPHKLFVFTRMSNLLLNLAIIEVKNIPNHLLICLIYNARWTRPPQTPLRMQFLHVQLFCWFLAFFGVFWQFLAVFGSFWLYLSVFGFFNNFSLFLDFLQFLAIFGVFLTVFSCFWVFDSFWWLCRFSVFDGFITVFGNFWWFLWFLADFGGFGEFKIQWGHRPRVHTSMLNCA